MCDQLDLASVGSGLFDLFLRDLCNPCCRDIFWSHVLVKHESHQDGQFVGSIDPFHIGSRVSFCKALFLCVFQCCFVIQAFLRHHSKDIVGSSVENAHYFLKLVGAKWTCQCSQDRDTAAYAGFKTKDHIVFFRCIDQFVIVRGKSSFVCCYHMLTVFQSGKHECCSRFDPAQQLDHDVYFGILENFVRIGCEFFFWYSDPSVAFGVTFQYFYDFDLRIQRRFNFGSVHF